MFEERKAADDRVREAETSIREGRARYEGKNKGKTPWVAQNGAK